jgi:glycosyltransferase involved in cell wall biosynthesis
MRVALVCTQDRGGPVDLTVALARELAGRPGGPEVAVAGPRPVTSAGKVDGLLRPVEVRSKTDLGGARELRRILRAFGPDLVHTQDRRAALVGATLARRCAPIVVATYHGVPDGAAGCWVREGPLAGRPPAPGAAAVLAADALIARLTTVTVTPSRAMASFLRQRLHVPPAKLHVIANGVALSPARPPEGAVRTFVSVGTFAPAKAVGTLVDAFAAVARDRPRLRLLLVGDGEERHSCAHRAAALGIDHLVEFTGYRVDVPDQLARAQAFVLPSVNENLPLALIEAMGAGLACVASRVGGVAELLGGGAGLLVRPGDPDALASAMAALADEPALAPALGRAAADAAQRHFSIDACADAHLALWSRLLGGRRS